MFSVGRGIGAGAACDAARGCPSTIRETEGRSTAIAEPVEFCICGVVFGAAGADTLPELATMLTFKDP